MKLGGWLLGLGLLTTACGDATIGMNKNDCAQVPDCLQYETLAVRESADGLTDTSSRIAPTVRLEATWVVELDEELQGGALPVQGKSGSLWVADGGHWVAGLDPETGERIAQLELGGGGSVDLLAIYGATDLDPMAPERSRSGRGLMQYSERVLSAWSWVEAREPTREDSPHEWPFPLASFVGDGTPRAATDAMPTESGWLMALANEQNGPVRVWRTMEDGGLAWARADLPFRSFGSNTGYLDYHAARVLHPAPDDGALLAYLSNSADAHEIVLAWIASDGRTTAWRLDVAPYMEQANRLRTHVARDGAVTLASNGFYGKLHLLRINKEGQLTHQETLRSPVGADNVASGLTVDDDGNAIVLTRGRDDDEETHVLCAVPPASRARCVQLDTGFGRYAHLVVRNDAVFVQDRFKVARFELAPLLAAAAADPIRP